MRSGGLGVMRQFIGSVRDATTVRGFLAAMAPLPIRGAAQRLEAAERAPRRARSRRSAPTRRRSPTGPTSAAGTPRCCGRPASARRSALTLGRRGHRPVSTLSGGEQKRLALEALLRGPDEVLLLDEPDNYLDVPGKRWLEERLADDAEDGAVRHARPRADRRDGAAHRHGRGAHGVDARRRASRRTTRRAPTGSRGSTSSAAAGTRSTPPEGAGAHAAGCRRRSRPTWRAATGRCRRGSRSSRRPGRRPSRRATRPSRCA